MLLTILHCVVFTVQATGLGNTSQKALHQEVKTDVEETPSFKEAPVTVRSHGSHSPSHMSPFHEMGMKTSMMNEKVPLEDDGLAHETSRSLSNKGLGYYSGFTRPHMTIFRPAGKELPPSSHREKRSHRQSLSRGNGLETTMSKIAEEKTRVADEVSGIVSRTSLGYSSGITRSDMTIFTQTGKIGSSLNTLMVTRDIMLSQEKDDKTGTPVTGSTSTSSVRHDSAVTLADPTSTVPYRSTKNPHKSYSNITLNITSTNPYNNLVGINFQSESSPSTTALPYSESPSSLTERQCDEVMFDFARQYDLCTRFRSTLPSESCRNRCGREPSFEESLKFCSCDVKCLVYEDCCVDFIDECPSIVKQSREMFKDKASTYLQCVGKYKSISSCPGLESYTFSPPEESTILSTTLPTTQASTTPNTHRALEFLENNFGIVIDLSTNLSYNRLEDYECNRSNTSVPFLVPYMIALNGTYMEGQSINSYVFPDDLFYVTKGTISTDPYKYTLAPGIRGCYTGDILHCQNCLNAESWVTLIKMCETLNHSSNIQRRNSQALFRKRNAYNHVLEKSTKCSLLSNLKQENQAYKRNFYVLDRIQEDNLPQKMVLIKPESDIFSEAKLLEFIGAPWKTIRCESRNMVLDDCDILQCSLGYLPTKDNKCSKASYLALEPDAPQTLGELQENSTQRIPVCTCMNVYWALVELSQWDLGNAQFSIDLVGCQFIVQEFLMDLRSYKASKLFDTVRHQGTLKSPRDEFSSRYLPEDINADYKLLHKEIVMAYFDALYSCQDDYVKARACFKSSQTVEIDANAANGRDCFQIDEMAYKFYMNVGDESLGIQNMAVQSIPADVVSQMASYLLALICTLLAM